MMQYLQSLSDKACEAGAAMLHIGAGANRREATGRLTHMATYAKQQGEQLPFCWKKGGTGKWAVVGIDQAACDALFAKLPPYVRSTKL